ncbi:hypothetical protein [Nonomuraea sp. NPDC049750]|uniref:hypothetical protein n=1 Tax=Nonomuraea sp. NPDC049750 TaxID=3154738 RepID=UPI00340E6030
MALQYVKLPSDDAGHVIATARLCLTEDGRLVPDTDEAARWLYCVPGVPIKRADAERYGLLDEPEPTPEPEPEPEPAKARSAPPNKARSRAADK